MVIRQGQMEPFSPLSPPPGSSASNLHLKADKYSAELLGSRRSG